MGSTRTCMGVCGEGVDSIPLPEDVKVAKIQTNLFFFSVQMTHFRLMATVMSKDFLRNSEGFYFLF